MNETGNGRYPSSYEQYALACDSLLDLITQIKSWQNADKLDKSTERLEKPSKRFNLVNGIVMNSARVDILDTFTGVGA